MLAVSVSFLAVPGVTLYNLDNNNNYHPFILKSSSQIASALSVETSIGSIVIGMFLVRHNRTKQEASPSEAVSEQSHATCVPTRHLCRTRISYRTVDGAALNRWLSFLVYRGHCSCGRTSSPISRTLILSMCTECLLLQQDGNILRCVVVLLFRHLEPLHRNNCRRDVGPRVPSQRAVSTDRMGVWECTSSVDRWLTTVSRRPAATRPWECRAPYTFCTSNL